MSLHRYFQTQPHQLHGPSGPLSLFVPPAAIEGANVAVTAVNESSSSATKGKQGSYLKLSGNKGTNWKYASENGDSATYSAGRYNYMHANSHAQTNITIFTL